MLSPVLRLLALLVITTALTGCGESGGQDAAGGPVGRSSGPSVPARVATDKERIPFTHAGVTSSYHLFARGVRRPAGLLVEFHGDGAREYLHPHSPAVFGGPEGITAQARRRGLVTVVMHTPDHTTQTWWEDPEPNSAWAAALLRHLQKRFHTRTVWLVGYSGGAQFVTEWFLPEHARMIARGGAVLFAGGEDPAVPFRSAPAGLAGSFRMHWFTGADDDGTETGSTGWNALADARTGLAWYAAHGFRTSHEWTPGTGHHFWERFGPVVGRQLDAADAGRS